MREKRPPGCPVQKLRLGILPVFIAKPVPFDRQFPYLFIVQPSEPVQELAVCRAHPLSVFEVRDMPAVPQDHARPVLSRVIVVFGFHLGPDVLPRVFRFVVVLDDLDRITRVSKIE